MKIDPSVLIQKQVRENSQDVQNFMLDLKNWESGIKKQEQTIFKSSTGDKQSPEKIQVTREDVDYVKTVFEDGVRQMKNAKWELAALSFSKAINKYKKNPSFFLKRAKCYLKLKKPKEAESDCSAVLKLDPKILKAKFYRSKAREMDGNLRGACLDLQDIIILDPGNQTAKAALDRLRPLFQSSQGGVDSKLFNDELTNKEIGVLDVISGNDNASEEAELEEKIQRANIEKENGNKFVKEGMWREAKEAYSKAIQIYPDDAIFYANRALCYLKLDNAERAILDCGMALLKNPRYAKAYFRRAAARKEIKDYWGARYDIKQLLHLEPNNNLAKQELEQLNIMIEENIYAEYTIDEMDSGSSDEESFASADDHQFQLTEDSILESNENISSSNKDKLEFKYIFPIDKPPHERSKKPLKRVSIKFIDNEAPNMTIEENKKEDKIPDWLSKSVLTEQEKENMLQENINPETEKTPIPKPMPQPQRKRSLPKNEKEFEESIPESIGKNGFKYVFPINKKPHQQSKKPLMRVPIKFI